jgi:PadR family transcriptional regulator, regulatory protein PadR
MIATERNEMALTGLLKSLQTPRHEVRLHLITTPLKPKDGLNGAPSLYIRVFTVSCCFPKGLVTHFLWETKMKKKDVLQGTLALMVLKTLDVLGPLHGYGIARRIEQISGDLLAVNQGTLYPVLLKLEQEGSIASDWGASENNRRARFYRLTREGRKQLQVETHDWQQTAAIIGRFFEAKAEDLS